MSYSHRIRESVPVAAKMLYCETRRLTMTMRNGECSMQHLFFPFHAMPLDSFDHSEPEQRPEAMQEAYCRPSRASSCETDPLKTPIQLFIEKANEFPLLTASLERKLAELKDKSEPFFREQATILERAILDHLDTGHVARSRVIEALEKIKALILQRESAMVNDRPYAMGEALSVQERDRLADAAFRRMVRSSRNKRTFDPVLVDADVPTDEVFARNLFVVMQKHVGLCQRIITSDIEEVAALASITREFFALLRGALPAGDPALQSLAECDAAFETEITGDEECREYIEPLLRHRSLTGIGVETPQYILMRANMRLVVKIARGYQRHGLELPDLIQDGNLGLYRAIEAFDLSRNVRFGTYATFWINQTIQHGLIVQREIHLPRYVTGLVSKWNQAIKSLHDRLGREPREEDIQTELNLTAKKLKIVRKALKLLNVQFQSNDYTDEAGAMPVANMVEDHDPSASDRMAQADEKDLIAALLDKLDPQEAQIIRLRFPKDGSKPKTLLEIGKMLGLTRERIRQIENEALRKLRNAARDYVEEDEHVVAPKPVGGGRRGRQRASPVGELHVMPANEFLPDSNGVEEALKVGNYVAMPSRSHSEVSSESGTPENGSARKFTIARSCHIHLDEHAASRLHGELRNLERGAPRPRQIDALRNFFTREQIAVPEDVIGHVVDHLDAVLGNVVAYLNHLAGGSTEMTEQEPARRQTAAHRSRLTEEDDRVPSLPLSASIPMPRSPDAESKRQNLTSEEKSVVQQNIQSLIDEHTCVEIVRRIREKCEYSDGAIKQAIRKAKRGMGLSPKYVSDIADIFGVDVVSGACRTEAAPTGKEEPTGRDRSRARASEAPEVQGEVLAQEVQLTETYRQKLAEALKVSLVKTPDGKVVFRVAQTDVEPV